MLRSKRILVLGASLIVLAVVPLAAGSIDSKAGPAAPSSYVPGELLVRFQDGASVADVAAAHAAVGATVLKSFTAVPNLQHVRLAAGSSVPQAVARYRGLDGVLYAQPNFVYEPLESHLAPNDPLYPQLWGLNNTGQTGGTADADIDAPEAWNITTGSGNVAVGVLDTGVSYTHVDLAANTRPNTPECNGTPGVDDEGNGYVDDCHGIDPRSGDTDPMEQGGSSHGTHTSGTVGAVGNNAVGVVGVNWNVDVIHCKIFQNGGSGTAAAIIECLEYMEIMQAEGHNVVATSNSYRGCSEACGFDQATHDAIESNLEHGILFVAAAGNEAGDNDVVPGYPTNYFLPNVISVAATDHRDLKAGFSSFGNRTVHVGAPGVDVLSTTPGNSYSSASGTSMATPHVAGLAALLEAQDPSRDWRDIRNLIFTGGDPKPSMQTTTVTGRRLNANGSATCTNKPLFAVLRPLETQAGTRIPIAVLNVNCGEPVPGPLSVRIKPGRKKINLKDDGTGADQAALDGTYSGEWKPRRCRPGTYTFRFSNGQSVQANITC
jgi:subtilisin family serine protease